MWSQISIIWSHISFILWSQMDSVHKWSFSVAKIRFWLQKRIICAHILLICKHKMLFVLHKILIKCSFVFCTHKGAFSWPQIRIYLVFCVHNLVFGHKLFYVQNTNLCLQNKIFLAVKKANVNAHLKSFSGLRKTPFTICCERLESEIQWLNELFYNDPQKS